jgi:hypothetical protein
MDPFNRRIPAEQTANGIDSTAAEVQSEAIPATADANSAIPATTPPLCSNIDEVIAEMTSRWNYLRQNGDWRQVFARTYLRTTYQILEAVQQPGLFKNPDWVVQLDCTFAQLYFAAADSWNAGDINGCPLPWRLAFQGAQQKRTLVFQDILLGMSAHINHDLPYALHSTIPAHLSPEEMAVYRKDHNTLNRVLAKSVNELQRDVLGRYDPLFAIADQIAGDEDEIGSSRMVAVWRTRSWGNFLLLHSAEDADEAKRIIEVSSAEYALMMLTLQRLLPGIYWPNRMYRDSIAWFHRRRAGREQE